MKSHNAQGHFRSDHGNINFNIFLLSFKEDDAHIVYAPQLDVSGYGNSKEEAFNSFNIVIEEFLSYTINKKTLHDELIRLGWQLKKGTPKRIGKATAPDLMTLMQKNEIVKEVVVNKDYEKMSKDILIPV